MVANVDYDRALALLTKILTETSLLVGKTGALKTLVVLRYKPTNE